MGAWVHLITVGASIAQHAINDGFFSEQGISKLPGLEHAFRKGALSRSSVSLSLVPYVDEKPKERSAELNTCMDLLLDGYERGLQQYVYLFHTDTEVGRLCAEVLQGYLDRFSREECGGRIAVLDPVEIEHLGDPRMFREGLANLLEGIAAHTKSHKRKGDTVFVHATGGFKPETAMALLASNLPTTGAPVFYVHEHFEEVVRIPAVPLRPRRWRRFDGLMDHLLTVGGVPRSVLDGRFVRRVIDEAVRLGWAEEVAGEIAPSAMGRLLWRRLLAIVR